MGRIRSIAIRLVLHETGYVVELSVFDAESVILRERYDRLAWREAVQVVEALTDAYRPGLELLAGGTQIPLF